MNPQNEQTLRRAIAILDRGDEPVFLIDPRTAAPDDPTPTYDSLVADFMDPGFPLHERGAA